MLNLLSKFFKSAGSSSMGPRSPDPVIWIPSSAAPRPDKYLACVAMIKDEAKYLDEWISFHLLAGVEHIYFYDNDSTDETSAVLARFIDVGKVTVIRWPHFTLGLNTQCLAYSHAISSLRGEYKWVAFIDVDEFLFPVTDENLRQVLRDYEDVPSLGVYWVNFGTSGHAEHQAAGVLSSYRKRQAIGTGPQGKTVTNYKSIVQPTMIDGVISAHAFHSSLYPILALDEERKPILHERFRNVRCNRIRINHYFTKSAAEWTAKLAKSSCRAPGHNIEDKRLTFFEAVHPLDCEDNLILEAQSRLKSNAGPKMSALK